MNQEEKIERRFLDFIMRRKIDVAIVLVGALLGIYFNWSAIEIIIFAVFIWSFLGPIPSRIIAIPAIFFLTITPILLLLKRTDRAEEFAIYAYYFLCMAIIRGIVEIRSEKSEKEQENNS